MLLRCDSAMAFREVSGHRALIRLLARAVARGTLPPSLILAGPDGVGKRLAATALAQALNCEAPVRGGTPENTSGDGGPLPIDACGRCRVCDRIARDAHPDVLLLGAEADVAITVDEVRRVVGEARYRPFEGRRRVLIINDADRLVPQAQNALLKTLEEPPAAAQFLLVTSRSDRLLATVRSRCQRISFGHLGTRELAELLVRCHGYEESAARAAASAAGGSAGRAVQLASGELAAARDAALALLTAVARGRDARGRLEGAKRLLDRQGGGAAGGKARRADLAHRLRALASLLRDITLLASGADRAVLANPDLHDRFAALAPPSAARWGVTAFAAVDEALEATERNASPKVVADWIACRL